MGFSKCNFHLGTLTCWPLPRCIYCQLTTDRPNKGIRIPESGKLFLVESGIQETLSFGIGPLGFRIQNRTQGIWNLAKVYNHFSTESNIGSRKICMDKLVFIKVFVPPATPLPPPALEMDTQDAGVTLLRSVAKLQLLKFDARSHYFERTSYFAELNLVITEFVVCILAHFVQLWSSPVLVNSL